MATRYDTAPLSKKSWHQTSEGYLFVPGVLARDGVLEYRRADGSIRRELRLPETNRDPATLQSFASLPVTIEHPPELVNANNTDRYSVGQVDPEVLYEEKVPGKGFVSAVVRLFQSRGVNAARNDAKELSVGYTIELDETPGVWTDPETGQRLRYDAIQKTVRGNHLALTRKARAGPECCLRIDSDDDVATPTRPTLWIPRPALTPPPYRPMSSSVRIDNADYPFDDPGLAGVVSRVVTERDDYRSRLDSLAAELEEAKKDLEAARQESAQETARAERLEEYITELHAYRGDSCDGDADEGMEMSDDEEMKPKKKKKGKKQVMKQDAADDELEDEEDFEDEDADEDEDEDETDEEYDEDEDYDEEMEDRTDSVARLVDAWQIARAIAPDMPYDPTLLDSRAIKLQAIARVDSELAEELEDESEDFIDGALMTEFGDEDEEYEDDEYEDEEPVYQRDSLLNSVVESRRATGGGNNAAVSRAAEIGAAWQQPLSMSKAR